MALRAIWEHEDYFYAFQNRLDVSEGNFEKRQNGSEDLFSRNCPKNLCDSWLIACKYEYTDTFICLLQL